MAAALTISSSTLGTALQSILMCDDIQPGSTPSYEVCKLLYLFHPIGAKMAEAPIKMAQRLPRTIKVTDGPEDDLVKAFNEQWERDDCHRNIRNLCTQARVYGVASVGLLEKDAVASEPVKFENLADADISFNVFDPLNTAGSLVLDQDPNSLTFQKHVGISVAGTAYHRSRSVTLFNEQPIYIAYTSSAFGFSGRSVYQRALFPLKSFINTMYADDMVARKVGLIIATIRQVGSIIDNIMQASAAFKRRLLKVAQTDNVISINEGESVESLNLQNLDGPLTTAKRSIIENIATAADMPAKILLQETFAEGFGEGTEDANYVADFLDEMRVWMAPAYRFFDRITMHRAWNPRFFKALQDKYGVEAVGANYQDAFLRWRDSFSAEWPSLRREPESARVGVEVEKLQAALAVVESVGAMADPANVGQLLEWLQENLNNSKGLFTNELSLDLESLIEDMVEQREVQAEMEANAMAAGGEDDGPPANQRKPPAKKGRNAKTDSALSAYLGRAKPFGKNDDIPGRIARIEDYLSTHKRVAR